jgi:hypothetical protein
MTKAQRHLFAAIGRNDMISLKSRKPQAAKLSYRLSDADLAIFAKLNRYELVIVNTGGRQQALY